MSAFHCQRKRKFVYKMILSYNAGMNAIMRAVAIRFMAAGRQEMLAVRHVNRFSGL
jgi:hypothetical protein